MKIDNAVLNVLDAADMNGNELRLTGQLDRTLYLATNKVLESAGGKWNRKARAHVFGGDAAEIMDQIILTGEVTTRQETGYFPTPPKIVQRLIELAELEPLMGVLEPSAGCGAIIEGLLACGESLEIVCYELDKGNKAALEAKGWPVSGEDFLQITPYPNFDRVIMNPPFAKQADIHHVNHALKFLKPDGVLVSVMAAGVTFRSNQLSLDFCRLLTGRGGTIEALPDGAFKESGTLVRTVIVRIPGPEYVQQEQAA